MVGVSATFPRGAVTGRVLFLIRLSFSSSCFRTQCVRPALPTHRSHRLSLLRSFGLIMALEAEEGWH